MAGSLCQSTTSIGSDDGRGGQHFAPFARIIPRREGHRCGFEISGHNERIVTETSVEAVQGRGGHAWLERTGQKIVHDRSAGGDGFVGSFEQAMVDPFAFVLVVEIVVDEDRVSHTRSIACSS